MLILSMSFCRICICNQQLSNYRFIMQEFKCCNVNFYNFRRYNQHMKASHSKDRLECAHCFFTTNGFSNAMVHFNRHHRCTFTVPSFIIISNNHVQFAEEKTSLKKQNECINTDYGRTDCITTSDIKDIYSKFLLELKVDCGVCSKSLESINSKLQITLSSMIDAFKVVSSFLLAAFVFVLVKIFICQ